MRPTIPTRRPGPTSWAGLAEGLQLGNPSAYLVVFGLLTIAIVALLAGANMQKKGTRR